MSETIGQLRESLRNAQVKFGIAIGGAALCGTLAVVETQSMAYKALYVLGAIGGLGEAAFEGMRAHNLGQEVAARQAVTDTARRA